MKNIFLEILFLICITIVNAQGGCLVDIKGDKVNVDTSKINYFVPLYSTACHNCYLKLNEWFEKMRYYDEKNVEINIVCIDGKKNISTATGKRYLYEMAFDYFPKVQNVYYYGSDEKTFQLFGLPLVMNNIVVLKNNGSDFIKYNYDDIIHQSIQNQ